MRRLVSPRKLLGHLAVLACAALFVRLGVWQWAKSQSPAGTLQNLGYALQWPLFAAFVVGAWGRILWFELHPPAADRRRQRLDARRQARARPAGPRQSGASVHQPAP